MSRFATILVSVLLVLSAVPTATAARAVPTNIPNVQSQAGGNRQSGATVVQSEKNDLSAAPKLSSAEGRTNTSHLSTTQ